MGRWIGLAAAAVAAYVVAALWGSPTAVLALKPLPVALLAVGALLHGTSRGSGLVAAGLAVGAVADLAIEWSFLAGLGLFLLAHLAYAAGFTRDAPALHAGRGIPFLLVFLALGSTFAMSAGDLGIPVAVYALVICLMGWRAAARLRSGDVATRLGLVGVGLFVLSDSLIAVDRFVSPLPWRGLWILGTYWSAQALIAASVTRPR